VNEMRPNHGTLIAFEGIDGSGKSTHIRYLFEHLYKKNVSTAIVSYSDQDWFREAYINQPRYSDPNREMEFFAWAFNTLVDKCVDPLLREGKVVLVDRYSLSYFAYQSFHGVATEVLASNLTGNAPTPDLLIILDVPLETALNRCHERDLRGEDHRVPFALTTIARLEHVASYYKRNTYSGTLIIDGQQPLEEVSGKIWCAVKRLLDLS
jgi:dTMP kinase